MSMSIGGISPYAAYNYLPPQPPEIPDGMDAMDTGMDFGLDDMSPVDFSQVLPIQNQEQMISIQSAESARGSDRDGFRREHSTTQQDLREIQAAMMGFSTRRMWELQNMSNI